MQYNGGGGGIRFQILNLFFALKFLLAFSKLGLNCFLHYFGAKPA